MKYNKLISAAITAALLGTMPAGAQEAEIVAEGVRYIVNADNTKVLRTEALTATESYCTPESPCLYDNLPLTADFVAQGNKWLNGQVTYSFVNDSPDIAVSRERGIIGQAMGLWSNVAKVYPREVASTADPCVGDIKILFGAGEHGDGFPFDGPSGVLAHAFFPPPNGGCWAGDSHFDEAEVWSQAGSSGIDLATVAAHEFGHALGLNHSADPNSIMAPFYIGRRAFLSFDDIAGIISIYGNKTADIILQLEETNTVAPGAGSFRLAPDSVQVGLRRQGTSINFNTILPSTNSTRSDVDGVLSRGTFTTRFDGFWFNRGDLYRTQTTLPAVNKDVDLVSVRMTVTNNTLAQPASLTLSMNGLKVGDIIVNPGDTVKNVSFPVHFPNPVNSARREASALYNDSKF